MADKDLNQDLDFNFKETTDELLAQIRHFYHLDLFCDLKLIAGTADIGFNTVNCHTLVLSSAIPRLVNLLQLASDTSDNDFVAKVYLPDFNYQDLKNFIDSIYMGLSSTGSHHVFMPHALAQSLGLTTSRVELIKTETCDDRQSQRKRIKRHEEIISDNDEDFTPDDGENVEECAVKIQVKVQDQPVSGITHFSSRSIEQVIEEQMINVHQLLPYNWSLSEPSLFSSAVEYQKLLESFCDAGSVIHAMTGPHFEMNSDECYPNTKVKKLVKMPPTEILALVKIGIRQGTGTNILQPIAVKHWHIQTIFDHLLESLLKIAGISKFLFYSSDRYYKFKKVASKPNRVGRALQGLKKLQQDELDLLKLKTCQDMKQLQEIHHRLSQLLTFIVNQPLDGSVNFFALIVSLLLYQVHQSTVLLDQNNEIILAT